MLAVIYRAEALGGSPMPLRFGLQQRWFIEPSPTPLFTRKQWLDSIHERGLCLGLYSAAQSQFPLRSTYHSLKRSRVHTHCGRETGLASDQLDS